MSATSKGHKARWTWLPANPSGGAGGAAYSKFFRNDALPMAGLLAREVLQNSWDAAQRHVNPEAPPFRFVFRFRSVSGVEKRKLLELLDASALVDRYRAVGASRDMPDKAVVNQLEDPEAPLRVLYLEDFGTHGMFGDPRDTMNSHLYRAMYILGSTRKDTAGVAQGGSYGFGKSAFIGSSALRTAISYTRFEPRPSDSAQERLIGFTWWGDHVVEGATFEGRAMFGWKPAKGSSTAPPIEDDAAAQLATALGMSPRSASLADMGSSVMLLAPVVEPAEVCTAVETFWWPALEENLMDVVIEGDDGELYIPRPKKRRELFPFLRAFGIANGLKEPNPVANEKLPSRKWRASEGVRIGSLALVVDTDVSGEPSADNSLIGDLSGPLVALVRGPRMVIEYKAYRSRLPIRGVFVASQDVDGDLREVEPPSHNTWDNSAGLDVDESSRRVAQRVLRTIRNEVRSFAQELTPPPSLSDAELPLFGSILGRYLGGRGLGPNRGPDGSGQSPAEMISFHVVGVDDLVRVEPGIIKLTRRFEVRIPRGRGWRTAILNLRCDAAIAEDLTGRRSDPVEIEMHVPPGFEWSAEREAFEGVVEGGTTVSFSVSTSDYADDLSVIFIPSAELILDFTSAERSA